jgi:outer membrane lipoprotein SlyB
LSGLKVKEALGSKNKSFFSGEFMKKTALTVLTVAVLISSCENKTETGALVGAGTGALAGGLIGGNITGVVVGGAIGAAAGGLIGYALDEQDRKIMEQRSPQTLKRIDRGEQLTLDDIKNMTKNGLNDDTIINQIKATNSSFRLTTSQIIDLKNSGVSQRVIDYMIQTGE